MKFLSCVCVLLLSACASDPFAQEHAAQRSVRALFRAQVFDPAPARQPAPAGMDGEAARRAQQRYEQTFGETPADRPLMQGGGK